MLNFFPALFGSFERVRYQEKKHEIDFEGLGWPHVATRILLIWGGFKTDKARVNHQENNHEIVSWSAR